MPLGFSDALVFILNLRSPSTSQPRRQRLRRPIKISSPIVHESLQFNVNAMNSTTQPESPGLFYLVSNRSGTGKTIVHRPRPPSQSSPRHGNFDDLPRGASTSKDVGLKISRPRKRPVLAIRTSPPPVERRLDSPSIESKYLWLDPVKATWNSIRRKNRNSDQWNGNANGNDKSSKGKQRADDHEEEDDETRYGTSKTQEIRAWMMGKSVTDVQRSATYPHRQSDARRSSNQKKSRRTTETPAMLSSRPGTSSMGRRRKGPPPGQTYEMINHQIIEKNPDKTVELSTWKEQSEKPVSPGDAERISVYYVTAGELELGEDKENIQVEWRTDWPTDADTHQRVPSSVTASKRVTADEIFVSRRRHSDMNVGPSGRHGTISPTTSEREESSGTDRKPSSKPKDALFSPPPPPPPDKGHYSQSTPIEKDLPPFPFHPTRSGSTISSIKSDSTLQLETVLENCEPSLVHIVPTLQKLGIRTVEHLRAVANLTPATRDREIKEDALRMGITVMEWAIFVDKIFTL